MRALQFAKQHGRLCASRAVAFEVPIGMSFHGGSAPCCLQFFFTETFRKARMPTEQFACAELLKGSRFKSKFGCEFWLGSTRLARRCHARAWWHLIRRRTSSPERELFKARRKPCLKPFARMRGLDSRLGRSGIARRLSAHFGAHFRFNFLAQIAADLLFKDFDEALGLHA